MWRAKLRNLCATIAAMAGVMAIAAFFVYYRGGDDVWLMWSLVTAGVCAVFTVLTCLIAMSGEKGESSDW